MRRLDRVLSRVAERGDPLGADLLIDHLERKLAGEPVPIVVAQQRSGMMQTFKERTIQQVIYDRHIIDGTYVVEIVLPPGWKDDPVDHSPRADAGSNTAFSASTIGPVQRRVWSQARTDPPRPSTTNSLAASNTRGSARRNR